jgi:hypothetical protein
MAWMVDDSAFALDQLGNPRQGPKAHLVAECLGAAQQSLLDPAQIGGSEAGSPSPPAGCLQPFRPHVRERGRPAADGLAMDSDLPRHIGLTPTRLEQLRRLQPPILQGFKIAFDSPWVSHEETLHEKCQNVTILCDSQ